MSESEDCDHCWSDEKENVLKIYAEECECLYVTYTKEYVRYRLYGYFFTIPGIIISTVTGLLSFDQNFNSSQNGPMVTGSLNILVAVLGTIYKVLKYAEYEAQFKFLSGEHLKLYVEIQSMLEKSPEERDNAQEFIRKIESRRLQLLDDAPVISDKTMNKFKRKYKDKISVPLLLNKLTPIRIYGKETEQSIKSESISNSLNISAVDKKEVVVVVEQKNEIKKEVIKEEEEVPNDGTTVSSTDV